MITEVGFEWQLRYKAGMSQFGQMGTNVTLGDSEMTVGSGTQPSLHLAGWRLCPCWGAEYKHKHLESHKICLKTQFGKDCKLMRGFIPVH